MKPSTQAPVRQRVILCQRAQELADVASLLAELGVDAQVCEGGYPSNDQLAGAALVVLSAQRLADGKAPAIRSWPRTLAVLDDASRTLVAHLSRIGISMTIRRPIHPRALRLILLHEIYRGPERRTKKRVMIGHPIRVGTGLFKQDATLLELSRTGARIEIANPPKIGAAIQFMLGKELTLTRPLKVNAKVVRILPTKDGGAQGRSELGITFVDPTGELARPIQAIVDRYANGTACAPAIGKAPADPGSSGRSRPAPAPEKPAAVGSAPQPATRPPAEQTDRAAAAAPKSAKPAAPNGPKSVVRPDPTTPIRALPPSYSGARPLVPTIASPSPDDDSFARPTPTALVPPTPELALDLPELEGDESDLDYELELELDEEIAFEPIPDAEGSERRQSVRRPYRQRVVALDEQAARVVVGRDLSFGGMRIDPNPALRIGDVLKVALHAGAEAVPIVVLAAVDRDEGEAGLVLVFSELAAGQRERLEKILAAASAIQSADVEDGSSGSLIVGELLGRVARGSAVGSQAGFTLIELMVVAAIIGLLASVALPLLGRSQLRAKTSEVKANLSAIRVVEEAYFSEHGRYLAAAAEPALIPGPFATEFAIAGTPYAELGWGPDGRVLFSYAISTSADETGYTADAAADLDADGILQIWGYAKPDPLGALTAGGLGCNPALLDPEVVGSCLGGSPAF